MRNLLFLLLVFGFLQGCDEAELPNSGIEGQVFLGPINPVEQEGIPNRSVYDAVLEVYTGPDFSTFVRSVTTNEGSFRIPLEANSYKIRPRNIDEPAEVLYPRADPVEVDVVDGSYSYIEITFDSGIRASTLDPSASHIE